ncbi:MAG: magnesium protoporphyrin IX methyltransferase [Proteobacteria bacterium]|nr:magnesium protoporphyrin IX methyltransferase [Pseudomonadota bacterium]
MRETAYLARRGEIEEYFDRTAADAWARLTSDVPVSGIRKTVREGRDTMRALIGSWVAPPQGGTVLDAGCGTGLLATDLARAGAIVTAVDLSPTLVELARQRMPADLPAGCITYHAGDMLEQGLGEFDHLVAMDSLIHYGPQEAVSALEAIAPRVRRSMVVTFAPSNPLLMLMMWAGRLFPRGDRSPSIVPVRASWLMERLGDSIASTDWRIGRTQRVSRGFYTSQALELVRR